MKALKCVEQGSWETLVCSIYYIICLVEMPVKYDIAVSGQQLFQ